VRWTGLCWTIFETMKTSLKTTHRVVQKVVAPQFPSSVFQLLYSSNQHPARGCQLLISSTKPVRNPFHNGSGLLFRATCTIFFSALLLLQWVYAVCCGWAMLVLEVGSGGQTPDLLPKLVVYMWSVKSAGIAVDVEGRAGDLRLRVKKHNPDSMKGSPRMLSNIYTCDSTTALGRLHFPPMPPTLSARIRSKQFSSHRRSEGLRGACRQHK